jgi:K+-transporting ATPase KdpF subunit
MSGFEMLALALVIGLAAYLVYALLNPENF